MKEEKWNHRIYYNGKINNCYTQAILSCIMQGYSFKALNDFEIATSVLWGTLYREGDPNRIMDCYLDPDIGIDRALKAFNVSYQKKIWKKGVRDKEALEVLNLWLNEGPVVVGPLNMGMLPYIPQNNLLRGVDHYIVVKRHVPQGYIICDPEYVTNAFLHEEQLHEACASECLIEGTGGYTLRKIEKAADKIRISNENIEKIINYAIDNVINAEILQYGGYKSWLALLNDWYLLKKNPSLIRGVAYTLQNRIQRSYLSSLFWDSRCCNMYFLEAFKLCEIERKQMRIISNLIPLLLAKEKFDERIFERSIVEVARNEKKMAEYMKNYRS